MRGMEDVFEKEAREYNIDPLLVLAISEHESGLGRSYAGWFNDKYHNPFGLSSGGKLMDFSKWEEAIEMECQLLRKYLDKDRTDLLKVGKHYAQDTKWASKVAKIYFDLRNELETL